MKTSIMIDGIRYIKETEVDVPSYSYQDAVTAARYIVAEQKRIPPEKVRLNTQLIDNLRWSVKNRLNLPELNRVVHSLVVATRYN